MLSQNKRIAIVGGGPGGLTLARLLQIEGAWVRVYERDMNKDAQVQDGALDLHTESGLAALDKAGLMKEFRTHYRPGAELVRVVDIQAKMYSDRHTEPGTQKFGDKHHRPEIDRGPLRDILLNSLEPDTVVWNSHISSIEKVQDSWKLIFQNGDTVLADIVIGADGANSKIRSFVTDIKPLRTGITMVEGSIQDSERTAPHIHTLFNTAWMHEPDALHQMLNVFSGNIFKQSLFMGMMWWSVSVMPFIRKTLKFAPGQKVLE